jgi:hypothetical protein
MLRRSFVSALLLFLTVAITPADCWGRGFGGARGGGGMRGGGFSGGGMRGGNFGGGGFSGAGMQGRNFSGGGFQGGGRSGGNFNGGGFSGGGVAAGGFQGGGLDRGGFNAAGSRSAGGFNGGQGAGSFDRGGFGGASGFAGAGGLASARGGTPNRSELGNFLGLPSDEGMRSASGHRTSAGGNFDFNYGGAVGPRGGAIGGASATGPRDNTVGRAGAVGSYGGVAAAGGFEGANGASGFRAAGVGANGGVAGARGFEGAGGAGGIQGAAAGPGGRFAAGGAARGPYGGVAARGIAGGSAGVAGGYARVSPSGRYNCAVGVRTNFNGWGLYGGGWYTAHPGAWYAAGWATGAAWNAATWNSLGAWMNYYPVQPIYYDYGTNVTYQDGTVYIGDQSAGTSEEYYDQAAQLASTGAAAEASQEDQWLPLGVFALTEPEQPSNNLTLQLAVDKQGVIRGNYTDSTTGTTQTVQGSVDKQTQRAAFTIGDQTQDVVETGIYNLTKDEAPVLIHFGKERTEQWLLVRLKNPDAAGSGDAANSTGAAAN